MTDHPNNHPVWAYEEVEIVLPNPEWIELGKEESKQINDLLSRLDILEVEHIGSTSIEGLPAKPIIDLMAKIKTYDKINNIIAVLSEHGWHYVPPELDLRPWRRFFVKVKNDKRIAHLHLIREGEERWEQQLTFRDKLKESTNLVEQYANLKMVLSKQYKNDREAYSEAKKNFIITVLES